MTWGVPLLVSYHFAFSYYSWGSQGKNTEVACHSLPSGPHSVRPLHHDPTSNAEETEVEWFYEDLQDLLELTPKKDVLFIIGDWNAKVEVKKHLE